MTTIIYNWLFIAHAQPMSNIIRFGYNTTCNNKPELLKYLSRRKDLKGISIIHISRVSSGLRESKELKQNFKPYKKQI